MIVAKSLASNAAVSAVGGGGSTGSGGSVLPDGAADGEGAGLALTPDPFLAFLGGAAMFSSYSII